MKRLFVLLLAAAALCEVLKELDGADEREVAARHDGRRAVCKRAFLVCQFCRSAMEEVTPHRFKKNGEAACRSAAGEDDAGEMKCGSG